MPYLKSRFNSITIDRKFILDTIPSANATYIKVYLYILALGDVNIDFKSVANSLSLLESDVMNAVSFWENKGAFISENTPVEEPVTVKKSDYEAGYVSEAVIHNPSLRDMMAVSEELLAKPLTPPEMDTLFWLHDGLGLSPEAILMLLEYCVSKGKPHISYAEKVALSWCDKGLTTPEAISIYLRDSERRNEDINFITAKMGITGRPLTPPEEEYFAKWLSEYKMSREMIVFAYEKTIMGTGKLSFPYMDKILASWFSQSIFTVSGAQKESNSKKEETAKKTGVYDDFESFTR
ncbi:MAG: DnaD domain protein [Clostridia bacterium]|nr:DnaD domain protein [Clostridia bacterium]